MGHLSDNEVTEFFSLPARRRAYAVVANHLLLGCTDCRERITVRLLELEPHLSLESLDVPELFRRSSLRRKEAERAVLSWAHLSQLPQTDRLKALKRGRVSRYGLAAHVLDQVESASSRRRFENTEEHLRFAHAVIEALAERVYGAGPIADLLLRHQVTLAHVRRQEQDFPGALAALQKAEEFRGRACDRLELGRFWRVQAALLWDLGEFEDAAKAAQAATNIYAAALDLSSKGRALLQEGVIFADLNPVLGLTRAEESISLLGQIDAHLYVRGLHTVALCLIRQHREEEARRFLDSHEKTIREVVAADCYLDLLFLWLDTYILRSRGQANDAEGLLSYLSSRYWQEKMYQEMILVEIERLEIKVAAGKWKSALNLARRLTPQLGALGLRNDLLSMWATIQDGLAQKRLDLSIAQEFFRRCWRVPRRAVAKQAP